MNTSNISKQKNIIPTSVWYYWANTLITLSKHTKIQGLNKKWKWRRKWVCTDNSGLCSALCEALGLSCQLLPVSITYSAQSEPTPVGLGVLCLLKWSWHARVSTRNSANTVSREQPWRSVCNGELGSLCSYARKVCLLLSNLPCSFSLDVSLLQAFKCEIHTRVKKVLTLKCHEKLLKVVELL